MLENKNNVADESPKVDNQQAAPAPTKSFLENILETVPDALNLKKDTKGPEEAPNTSNADNVKDQPKEIDPVTKAYQEKLKGIITDLEGEVAAKKTLLETTKDDAAKFALDKEIFEKEKKIYEIKKGIEVNDTPDLSELNNFYKENNIAEGSETYKLTQKMLAHKGSESLIKLFLTSVKAFAADTKAVADKPVDINNHVKDKDDKGVVKAAENSFLDAIIKDVNKNK